MPGTDTITIEILEDGTARVTTDAVSPANHVSADALLDLLGKTLGGPVERRKRVDVKRAVPAHAHGGKTHQH